jgi:hypothetical protein
MSHVVAFVKATVSRGWVLCYKKKTAQSALLKNLSFVIFQSGGGRGCTCILSLHAVQEEDAIGWDVFLSDT